MEQWMIKGIITQFKMIIIQFQYYKVALMTKRQGKLCVIELGGTISCATSNPAGEFYSSTHNSCVKKITERFSNDNQLEIDNYPLFDLISHEISWIHLKEIGQFIQGLLDKNQYDGIVITVGTNALEDVAFFISVVINTTIPIVFTGAHYPQGALSFDGERNLVNALQIAASEKAINLGVLVTFGDYVVSARDAVKAPAGLPTHFANGGHCIGYVVGFEFILRVKPLINQWTIPGFHIDKLNTAIEIAVIYAHVGMNETVINAITESSIDGIVSAGFGKGYQSKKVTSGLKKAVDRGIVVVRCARSGAGFSGEDPTYDLENGFIKSSGLQANKVAILLFIALSCTKDGGQIKAIFTGS